MRIVIIAGKEVKIWRDKARIRCPNCAKNVFFGRKFIKEASALLGLNYIKRDKAYYIELGLKGMAKRWGKDLGHLTRKYERRLAKQVNRAEVNQVEM